MSERRGAVKRAPDRSRKARSKAALEPRKQPRQRRSSQMVDRILGAALTLTRENGAAGPTTLAIARRAGLSVGSVYQYYPNKQAIMLDLARNWLAVFPTVIAARAEGATTAERFRQDLHAYLEEIARHYLDNANLMPVLEAIALDPGLKHIVVDYDDKNIALYAAWLRKVNPALPLEDATRLGHVMMEVGHMALTIAVRKNRRTFALIQNDLETMWLALLVPHLDLPDT
ncbi:MAG: TetR/AcrR family transcriptional regulator [Mesorhizobium sp.]|nr:TetR/AcrR family transcriptional regulator [Mesorhizobium sp.]MBN9243777.1 TetR/AcrR family transcriptional regulator [Mesorhizobium sp.]